MPYYIHPKDQPLVVPGDDLAQYLSQYLWPHRATRQSAYSFVRERALLGRSETVTFAPSSAELSDWHQREVGRFADGTYHTVPWVGRERSDLVDLHYAHSSKKTPGMIAYTLSVEHGITDRQISINPGRYLTQFYADIFTLQEIAGYVAMCVKADDTFQIARTPEDIRTIYMSTSVGFSSCMQRRGEQSTEVIYEWQKRMEKGSLRYHPCEVYGDSDLGVAYRGPLDRISQRTVVWPAKHRYSRIYGTGTLEQMLRDAGYAQGPVSGARIRAILYQSGYVMPYIDTVVRAEVDDDDDHLLLGSGEIGTDCTCGWARIDRQFYCNHCSEEFTPIAGDHTDLCDNCAESEWTCGGCGHQFYAGDEYNSCQDESLCHDCYVECQTECQQVDCGERWIETEIFTRQERNERHAHGLTDLCVSCARLYTWCDRCEISHEEDTCPDCDRSPRCTHTADLLDAALEHETSHCQDGVVPQAPRAHPRLSSGLETLRCSPLPLRSLNDNLLTSHWSEARSEGWEGACLVYNCHATIPVGTRYLRTVDGFGYCLRCVARFRREGRFIPEDLYGIAAF